MGLFLNQLAGFGGGGESDPYWSNVSMLLHMNGANASTTFTDSSSTNSTMAAQGNAQISTAQSKFGGASGYFDGTGDYLTTADKAALQLSTGDFTIESWVYLATTGVEMHIASKGSQNAGWSLMVLAGNKLYFAVGSTGYGNSGTSLTSGQWYHIAVVRSGSGSNNLKVYLNGAQDFQATVTTDFNQTDTFKIGEAKYGVHPWNGYMDDFRLTKGVARYTGAFTVPASQFPDK